MQQLGAYVLSVTAAAIVVGILTEFTNPKSAIGTLIRVMGGLFLAFTAISPLVNMEFDTFWSLTEGIAAEGAAITAQGENMAWEELSRLIKAETEAYILDKAGSYQAELTAEVTLSDDAIPVPTGVTLRGDVSPYARAQLQKMLEDDFGIPKENQIWIQ